MTAERPENVRAAVLWMAAALVCFLLMALAGRELSREVSTSEILFFRSAVAVAILVPYLAATGWARVRTARLPVHLFRNCVHFAGQWGWFYAIGLIPMAEVFAIEFTSPIWTAILAAIFLGERLTAKRLFAILLGFAGVLAIIRPGLADIHTASLFALGGAVGYASTYVITRAITRTESALAIVFYMNLIQLPIGLAFTIPRWVTPSPYLWFWAVTIGVVGIFSHLCLARAFAQANAATVAPLDFLRLPLIAVIGYFAYDEALDPFVALGAVVILAGNWLNVRASAPPRAIASR